MLTDAQITSVARDYISWALKHACEAPAALAGGPIAIPDDNGGESLALSIYQQADGDLASEQKASREKLLRLRIALGADKFDWLTHGLAREFAKETGIDFDALDEDARGALSRAIMRARVEEQRIIVAQREGNYAETAIRDPLFEGMKLPLQADWSTKQVSKPKVRTLRSAIEAYMHDKTRNHAWVGKTVLDNQRALNWFLELIDPATPINAVSGEDIRAFRDALHDIPANLVKLPDFKDKKLSEILALVRGGKPTKRLAQHTRSKYMNNLKAFLSWCVAEGLISASPVGAISIPQPSNGKDQRHPFALNQLKTLFSSPQYAGHATEAHRHRPGPMIVRDGKFYLPVIALFTGMREGEIIQLLACDVHEIEGIWCIENTSATQPKNGPPKQFKTAAAERIVPVHPMLMKIGLIEYVKSMQQKGANQRLFPEILPGKKSGYWSQNYSKHFARYTRYTGIKTSKTAFHSFRHNFSDACDAAEIPQQIKMALEGHADDSVSGRYGAPKKPVRVLYTHIARIKYDLDLSHLFTAAK